MESSRKTVRRAPRARAGAALTDLPERPGRAIAELIGRDGVASLWGALSTTVAVDHYRADYRFYDELRNGRSAGYELSGLLCRPITQILASYIVGKAPTYTLVEPAEDEDDPIAYTNGLIEKFLRRNHARLLTLVEDLHALGDQFVIINPDGSLAVPPPNTVRVEYERWNPTRMEKVIVTTEDRGGLRVIETYTAEQRTVEMRWRGETRREQYDNLIGRLPVVHLANNRRANELYGRPEYEAMLTLLHYYDNLLVKAIQGAYVMGNPIPVMAGMENINETITANAGAAETYTANDGTPATRGTVEFDTNGMLFVGKGGKFDLVGPDRGFTEDMRSMLRSLFELVIDHVRIPELVYGTALGGNRASAETQIGPFVRFLDAKRAMLDGMAADSELGVDAEGGLYQLIDLWLRTRRLTDRRVVVDATRSQWPTIDLADENVKLQKIIYAHGVGTIDREETLALLNLVPNPPQSVARAQEEKAADLEAQDDFMAQLNRAARQDMRPSTGAMLKNSAPPDPDGGRNVPFEDGFVGELERIVA